MACYDLQITAPVLRAQDIVEQRSNRIARLNDQLADVQAELATGVQALRVEQEDLRAATKRQTEALAEEQGLRLRGQ